MPETYSTSQNLQEVPAFSAAGILPQGSRIGSYHTTAIRRFAAIFKMALGDQKTKLKCVNNFVDVDSYLVT